VNLILYTKFFTQTAIDLNSLFVCLFYFVADKKKLIEENKQHDKAYGAIAL